LCVILIVFFDLKILRKSNQNVQLQQKFKRFIDPLSLFLDSAQMLIRLKFFTKQAIVI